MKELLNKVKYGAYTSDWNGFNGIRSATPKLIDFYSGENGGVLDAFLCNKGMEMLISELYYALEPAFKRIPGDPNNT